MEYSEMIGSACFLFHEVKYFGKTSAKYFLDIAKNLVIG